jgi:hypothetical protein
MVSRAKNRLRRSSQRVYAANGERVSLDGFWQNAGRHAKHRRGGRAGIAEQGW